MQKGRGAYTGAACQSLTFNPSLVGAEDKAVRRENLGEIRICTLGTEGFVPTKIRPKCHDIDFFDIRDKDNGVWNTRIDEVNAMPGLTKSERLHGAVILRTSHFKSHQFSLQRSGDESGLGFKAHGKRFFSHKTRGKSCKATGAIPTHLRLASIAIVVAHAEIRLSIGWLHSQQTIRADSSMPVTETRYGSAIE